MNEKLKEFINAVGSMAEIAYVWYQELTKVGFSSHDALYLTGEYVKVLIQIGHEGNKGDE